MNSGPSTIAQLARDAGVSYNVMWRRVMKLAGRCQRCAEPTLNGSRCRDCAETERFEYVERRGRPSRGQRCSVCQSPEHTMRNCLRGSGSAGCGVTKSERQRLVKARRLAAGMCPECGRERAAGSRCERCRLTHRNSQRRLLGQVPGKRCTACGEIGHYRPTCTGQRP